ncbi:beta-galactosidase [Gilvimarinus japonicus]|uniref:Beta-galactosidase n=1 Tax=Gilvimarinus japonicus TaxID=1796469 RepID=A0ABV7HNN4_9GAMM
MFIKSRVTSLLLPLGCTLLLACSPQQAQPPSGITTLTTLYNFDHGDLPDALKITHGSVESTEKSGNGQAKITLHSKSHHSASFTLRPYSPWQWNSMGEFAFALDISNPSGQSTQLYATATDAKGHVHNRSFVVPAHSSNTYYMELRGADLSTDSGLRANPKQWQSSAAPMIWRHGTKQLDLAAINEISFTVRGLLEDKTLIIDNAQLVRANQIDPHYLTGLIDKFGQNAKQNSEYHVASKAQLIADKKAERRTLAQGSLTDRSTFSGWKDGPKLQASGYFRVAKYQNKWTLVDPEGYLFFSNGIANVRMANTSTLTGYDFDHSLIQPRSGNELTPEDSQGLNRVPDTAIKSRKVASELRADLFTWLPDYHEPLGKHYGYRRSVHSGPLTQGESYSFYRANLERKYATETQPDFMQQWRDTTVDRMLNWGFTSFGNWLDPDFYQLDRIPYFANGWIIGDFKTVSSGNDYWSPLPDPFDPEFAKRADITLKRVAKEVNNSPWCIGVFIDNEKSWGSESSLEARYGIALNTLSLPDGDSPTKARFTQWLADKYSNIESLNSAWNSNYPHWDSIVQGVQLNELNASVIADLSALTEIYASEYFRVVNAAVKRHLPNHLYMGARFADWGMTPEVRAAAAKYADVISYNYYKEGLDSDFWAFLDQLDKPAIIGEFHIGATDSGLFNPGLVHAQSQQDRATMYTAYMNSVIDNPYFVGAHWFQYLDSPVSGRAYDGENYNVGFVTVADRPYTPLVNAARTVNSELYPKRFK